MQLTYESNSVYYTDYYYVDEANDIYQYLIDMGGTKEYQMIDGTNTYFASFASTIDQMDISSIDWVNDFEFDVDKQIGRPISEEKINEIGKHIFGDQQNETFDSLYVTYSNGYISKVEAISIYQNANYYYTITYEDHGWVNFDLPTTTKDYVGNAPYYNNETYEGEALTTAQAQAIEIFDNSASVNYTTSSYWEQVQLGETTGTSFTTKCVYADNQCAFSYTDASTGTYYTDYLVPSGSSFIYFADDGAGSYNNYIQGTDEFSSAASTLVLDEIDLSSLKAEDFIYNGEYIMPKDETTARTILDGMFGYSGVYYGLHIYLSKDNVISKIETSLYSESSTSILSYKKTYTITNIGTSTIKLPDVIQAQI
jgi:hypothetical protein